MNDLRKAAEMALERFESHDYWADEEAIQALRQALNETPPCKTHPDAPHGFDRNASHSADRYVCECEGWEPVDAVNISAERVDETAKGEQEPFIYIREDTEMPFGGYEHCGQHEPGAFPVYTAPPKKEWVGLTDEEVKYLISHFDWRAPAEQFVSVIETKLKEKNNG